MALTVHTLELGRAVTDTSFFVRGRTRGELVSAPVHGYLILGGHAPLVVDTGYRDAEVMARIGMPVEHHDDNSIEAQLDRHGVAIEDVGAVIATHLHVDHAGNFDDFPLTTPVVLNRREIEFAASGLQGQGYAPEDLKHLIDRTHAPGGIRWLDLELTGPVQVAPGVRCEGAGGHTEGSLNVYVTTDNGEACICGDVLYDIQDQVVARLTEAGEPVLSNNFAPSARQETAAVKRVLNRADWLLPGHDRGARVVDGAVVGRVEGLTVPGPVEALPAEGAYRAPAIAL
ncbi:MAG TPA: MBL fold metallo-hydrolase [Pseudonocardia sp.]